MSKIFDYVPLDTAADALRLVDLHPSPLQGDPINCSMIYTTLSAKPEYDGLSYMWGSKYDTVPIHVDGQDMIITENLKAALVHLRCLSEHRRLWIDAICINQADVNERNSQVRQMGEIYSRAEKVIVWLGPEIKGSRSALEFLHRSATMFTNTILDPSNIPYGPKCPEGLERLLTVDYWRRVWIIQEFVLASKVIIQCGDDCATLTGFTYMIQNLDSAKSENIPEALSRILRSIPAQLVAQRLARSSTKGCSLTALLELSENSNCSDPRDKVYALLGLATDCQKREILADYSKTIQELYDVVLRFYISQGHKTTIARFSQFFQRSVGGIPVTLQKKRKKDEDAENASSNLNNLFETYAIFRGTVVHLNQPWKKGALDQDPKSFLDFLDTRRFTFSHYWNVLEDFLLQLPKGDAQKVRSLSSPHGYGEIFTKPSRKSTMMSMDSLGAAISEKDNDANENGQVSTIAPKYLSPGFPRKPFHRHFLFVDENGQVGLAPKEAQIGDIVCQFHFCDVALLARKQGPKYFLVGRILLAKRCDEVPVPLGDCASKYFKYSVPDSGSWDNFRNEIVFHLDIPTLRILTT